MTHPAITLANEIVTAINGGSYSESFTVVKKYLVETNREAITALTVTVKPDMEFHERRIITRGGAADETLEVVVLIEKPVDPSDTAAIETLLTLTDEIGNELRSSSNLKLTCGRLVSNPEDPRTAQIQLDESNYFLAAIRLRYKLIRS